MKELKCQQHLQKMDLGFISGQMRRIEHIFMWIKGMAMQNTGYVQLYHKNFHTDIQQGK